jgi:(2Fe-2S) ferredoxin
MKTDGYKAHLFICTNKKDGKTCCADKGAEALRGRLKDWAKKELGPSVRVNASGCLDRCEEGIVAVLYPESLWLTKLTSNDDDKLKAILRAAALPNTDY